MESIKKWKSSFVIGQASALITFFEKKYSAWEANYYEDIESIVIQDERRKYIIKLADVEERISIVEKQWWANIVVRHNDFKDTSTFEYIPLNDALDLLQFCQARLAWQKKYLKNLESMKNWLRVALKFIEASNKSFRWITSEDIESMDSKRPEVDSSDIALFLQDEEIITLLGLFPFGDISREVIFYRFMFEDMARVNNHFFEKNEYERFKYFFDEIEKSPLTREQAESVICFDNRVLSVASAGSGKTSTLIAKAGYAINKKIVKPEEILLLAFNKDAADEMKIRARDRLGEICSGADQINIQTFHAFGLSIIGQATGYKPTIAPWIDQGKQAAQVDKIIKRLCSSDKSFQVKWKLLVEVFSVDHTVSLAHDEYRNGEKLYKTKNGELVKSKEELTLANWLFFNGVKYEYEKRYEYETATSDYGQYHPDFYYPDIGVYHEHFALDEYGNAPEEFEGYEEGVEWKRKLHEEKGTVLLETTSASINNGSAFIYLKEQLNNFGLELSPDNDRQPTNEEIRNTSHFYGLLLTFLSHYKSNMLDDDDLLNAKGISLFRYRTNLFIDIFIKFKREWQSDLDAGNYVDFDDLLHKAASLCENNEWASPYKLIMVDEFQDTSVVRARLTKSLLNRKGVFLFAVGDDWQGINRFAGSDISVMSEFSEWFGKSQLLKLEKTFRCPQTICDISSQFIMKNSSQISKKVVSNDPDSLQCSIEVYQSKHYTNISSDILKYLKSLYEKIRSGEIQSVRGRKITVFFLGRYNRDRQYIPILPNEISKYIDCSFLTVHRSKGLEADIVVIPNLMSGKFSFPSIIEDDPVLKIAMPSGDTYPFAEERRLFYVALTRARLGVALFTVLGRMSPFVTELVEDHGLQVKDIDGNINNIILCSNCKGQMVRRKGRYGEFLGCCNFPRCNFTQQIKNENSR